MKLLPLHLLAMAGSFGLALCPPFIALGAASSRAVALQEEEDPFAVWKEKFQRAMEINAKPEMARLVKKDDRMAVGWAIVTCEEISEGSSEELETFIAALEEAWKTSMKTNFVRKVYEYFSLLDPAIRRERVKMVERYDKTLDKYEANLAAKDGPTFARIANEMEGFAKAFAEIGDAYHASQAWYVYAGCFAEPQRGADANNFKACAGYRSMLESRDQIELKDADYLAVEAVFKGLAAKGFDQDEAEAKAKGGPGPGVVAANAAATVALGFEMVEDFDTFQRPSYYADELFPVWNALALARKGSSANFLNLPDGPKVYRTGANEAKVDTDGDGSGDVDIPLTGNFMPIELEIPVDGEKQPWGFLAVVGNQQSTFQGLVMNLGPSDENMSIYVLGAGSMLGELDGIPVRIIDENMDGIYGSAPTAFGHVGLVVERKMYQPEMDSVVIGASKRAVPWSEFLNVEGQWYHVEPQSAGKAIKATKVEIEAGTLKLKYKGGRPTWLVVQGTGQFENSYFDLVGGGNKVEVPAGYYKLSWGELRKGKKQQAAKALILPGASTDWKVEVGKTTTIELGAPFAYDFDVEVGEDKITIDGQSVHVVGSGTERYGRLWNCVARPEASYRKAGTKKGGKAEKMRLLESQDQITVIESERPGEGWTSAWFPLDLELRKKRSEEDVEVQLFEKKNKLFGKIESDWKN